MLQLHRSQSSFSYIAGQLTPVHIQFRIKVIHSVQIWFSCFPACVFKLWLYSALNIWFDSAFQCTWTCMMLSILNVFRKVLHFKLLMWPTHLLALFHFQFPNGTSGDWMQVVMFSTNRQENWQLELVFLQQWCRQVPYLEASKVEPSCQLYRSASKLRPLLAFWGHNKNIGQKSANAKSISCVKYETKNEVKAKILPNISTAFLTHDTRDQHQGHAEICIWVAGARTTVALVKDIWNIQIYIYPPVTIFIHDRKKKPLVFQIWPVLK